MSTIMQGLLKEITLAQKEKNARRLQALRLIKADIQRKEVDERGKCAESAYAAAKASSTPQRDIELDDAQVLGVLDKMLKQRQDAFNQYTAAGRLELAAQEAFEMEVINTFRPEAATPTQITQLINEALAQITVMGPQRMGAAMAILKPLLAGRADMSAVSAELRALLAAS